MPSPCDSSSDTLPFLRDYFNPYSSSSPPPPPCAASWFLTITIVTIWRRCLPRYIVRSSIDAPTPLTVMRESSSRWYDIKRSRRQIDSTSVSFAQWTTLLSWDLSRDFIGGVRIQMTKFYHLSFSLIFSLIFNEVNKCLGNNINNKNYYSRDIIKIVTINIKIVIY